MKVCGFSFLRNAVLYDYPFEESIRSILPLCDKIIIAIGNSEDNTLERVRSIDPKIEILETVWDEAFRAGGHVLAVETNKAFQAIPQQYDWCLYIQGDEVIHEQYYESIRNGMAKYVNDKRVDGLLFNYKHFFGSYDYVGAKYSWYRREVRIIRNDKKITSYKDAQGFRWPNGDKLHVKLIDACIYHYGWVRDPASLQKKIGANKELYFRQEPTAEQIQELSTTVYNFSEKNEPVVPFTGTHPTLMKNRIEKKNWQFTPQQKKYASTKDKIKRFFAHYFNWHIGEFRNYKKI